VFTNRAFKNSKEGWGMATAASSREEFFDIVRAADPRSYVIMHEKLEYFANKKYAPPIPPYTPKFQEFVRVPQEMKDWVTTELIKVRDIFIYYYPFINLEFIGSAPQNTSCMGPLKDRKNILGQVLGPSFLPQLGLEHGRLGPGEGLHHLR
jgi:hypothetical protein